MTKDRRIEFVKENINKMSDKQLSECTGVHVRTIQRDKSENSIKRNSNFSMELCRQGAIKGMKVLRSKYSFLGANNANWKGGISKNNMYYKKRSVSKYPEKDICRRKLAYAVKTGKIKRMACEICGTVEDVHGHHEDYSKPLLVQWLCRKHHREKHDNKH